MNLLGYVKTNQLSYKEKAFNEVDALTIAWMSYFDFEPIKNDLPLRIKDLDKYPYYSKLDPYFPSFMARSSRKIMKALMVSKRYKEMRILDTFSLIDKKLNVQFAALAVFINNKIVIAYRGTDPPYTGWKEDFILSYKDKIHSYSLAEIFFNRIKEKYDEDIILCGHSKGGHIVTYLLSELEDASRIKHVYSFDGPGFRTLDLFKDKEDRLDKFTKIIPQSSFVGVLFSNETEMKIIKSRSVMMLQHNCLEWIIKNNEFIYVNKRTLSSRYLDKSINAWINSLDLETKERFTEILFGELDKFETQDFTNFFKNLFKQAKPAYKAYRGLSKEDKKLVFYVMRKLVRNLIKPEKKTSSSN